jgi:hypothetical protein
MAGRLFERFAGDDTGRSTGRGTGLGLAGVRAVLAAHGGTVAAGERPGGGASFELWLPAMPGVPVQSNIKSAGSADGIGPRRISHRPAVPRDGATASS